MGQVFPLEERGCQIEFLPSPRPPLWPAPLPRAQRPATERALIWQVE